MELEQKLNEALNEMKTFAGKAQEEIKTAGSVATETKQAVEKIRERMATMQTQLDAIDAKSQTRHFGDENPKSLSDLVIASAEYKSAKEAGFIGRKALNMNFATSAFPMERKTNITEANIGEATTGVIVPVRLPGLVTMPQIELRIRDLMTVVPQTVGNSFDYVYQATRTNAASPQVEASAKSQSYLNWQSTSGAIRTIAHYVNVSRQALDDVNWLRSTIDSELVYGLKVKEESEILSGDGTGVHLNGIITQATAFDSATYLPAGHSWTWIDVLRFAKLQARLAGLATYKPSAFVLHPTDLAKIELTKDSYGRYIVGDPKTGVEVNYIWKLPVVESDSISAGTFLVGAFDSAVKLVDRMAVSTEISYEHDVNFTTNMATILCEERIGLAVTKPAAFISGSFTASPAVS